MNSELEVSATGANYSSSNKLDVDNGFTIGYDYLIKNKDNFNLGIGAEFMLERGINEEMFTYHSLYGYGEYIITEQIYAFGKLGYNFANFPPSQSQFENLTDENGIYYAFGAGYSLNKKIDLVISYNMNSSVRKITTHTEIDKYDYSYSRISLGIIYNLF